MNTWKDLRRLLVQLERDWDVEKVRGDASGSGSAERQNLMITFKRKAKEEAKDDHG